MSCYVSIRVNYNNCYNAIIFSFRGTSWKITISSIYCRAQWMFVVKTGKLSRYFIYSNFSTNMLVHFYPKNLQSLWTFIFSYALPFIYILYLCTTVCHSIFFFIKLWILGKSVSLNCFVIFVFQRKSLLYQSNLPASSHKNL